MVEELKKEGVSISLEKAIKIAVLFESISNETKKREAI